MTAFHTIAIPHDDILCNHQTIACDEKKLLGGFLAGMDRIQEEVEKSESQGKLF